MKKIFTLLCIAVVAALACSCDDSLVINEDKLPEQAREFIALYFPDATVIRAVRDRDDGTETYDVRLSDGTELEFTKHGQWKSVDCGADPVPDGIVPASIVTYVTVNYPDETIVAIKQYSRGYEAVLSNLTELEFDQTGEFIRVDR